MDVTFANTVVAVTRAVWDLAGLLDSPLPHLRNREVQFNSDRADGCTWERDVLAPEGASLTPHCTLGCKVPWGRARGVCRVGAKAWEGELLESPKPPDWARWVRWQSCAAAMFPLESD